MASEGPLYPGTVTTEAVSTENANDWLTPGNIGADDGSEAQITAATYDSPDISFRLKASNFGFAIPAGSTINGITVEIDRRSIISNSGKDFRVQLLDAVGALVGTNKAATGTVWPTTSTVATYGGGADTWTADPTVAMVNDPGFGVVLSAQANIANADIGVDYIRVTVTYTAPAPSGSIAQTLPALAQSAAGALEATGTAAGTFPALTQAANGDVVSSITGAAAQTLPALAQAAAGDAQVVGAASSTLPTLGQAAVGSLEAASTAAGTLPTLTQAATGDVEGAGVSGDAAQALPSLTQAATAGATVTGPATSTLPALSQVASGEATVSGSAANALPQLSGTVAGAATVEGAAAQQFAGLGQQASGTVGDVVAGTATNTLPALTQDTQGGATVDGSAGQVLPGLTQQGSAVVGDVVAGMAASALPAIVMAAQGDVQGVGSVIYQTVPAGRVLAASSGGHAAPRIGRPVSARIGTPSQKGFVP